MEYRAKPPILASVLTSVVTTICLFFALRFLEAQGVIPRGFGGDETAEVPGIVGLRIADAKELLKPHNLLLVVDAERDDAKVPAGSIVQQSPLPGSRVPRGASVRTAVSRGLTQVAVPKVSGQTTEQAGQEIVAAMLQIGPTKSVANDKIPAGSVVQTNPPEGSNVAPRTAIELVVSSGPVQKPVPKLTQLRLQQAKQAIEQAGFTLGTVKYKYDQRYGSYVVLTQEPAERAAAAPGSAINLVVNEPD